MSAVSAWWRQRDARERWMLSVGAMLVAAMLLWAFAWKPLNDARAALVESNGRLATDLATMRVAAAHMRGHVAGDDAARARAGRSLLALADAGIREIGLSGGLKRIEPSGEGRVRVRLEAVAFDPLIGWLEALEREHGIRVGEMSATATGYVGQVDIQFVLEES